MAGMSPNRIRSHVVDALRASHDFSISTQDIGTLRQRVGLKGVAKNIMFDVMRQLRNEGVVAIRLNRQTGLTRVRLRRIHR